MLVVAQLLLLSLVVVVAVMSFVAQLTPFRCSLMDLVHNSLMRMRLRCLSND